MVGRQPDLGQFSPGHNFDFWMFGSSPRHDRSPRGHFCYYHQPAEPMTLMRMRVRWMSCPRCAAQRVPSSRRLILLCSPFFGTTSCTGVGIPSCAALFWIRHRRSLLIPPAFGHIRGPPYFRKRFRYAAMVFSGSHGFWIRGVGIMFPNCMGRRDNSSLFHVHCRAYRGEDLQRIGTMWAISSDHEY